MKYRLSEIAAMCGATLLGRDVEVSDVVTDSRNSVFGRGAMFVAMRGATHDSHKYIEQMYARSVRAFLVEQQPEKLLPDAGYLYVDNSLEALQRLAAEHRRNFAGRVVAITGSNGKTVVKEWVARVLPQSAKAFVSPMSYNSQLGVALSLLMIEGDEQFAIIEAGISQPNEMARLQQMIKPDVVVITSIGDAHQCNFESIEQKVAEKLILASEANVVIYHSAYKDIAAGLNLLSEKCSRVDAAQCSVEEYSAVNEAMLNNAQVVKALCYELGYTDVKITPNQLAMRLEVKEGIGGSTIINDSYNSDINSLAIALDTLRSIALSGEAVAVISDIEQSGMSDEELYGRVSYIVKNAGVKLFIGVGDRIARYGELFECEKRFYHDTDSLMRGLTHSDIAGRTILLKGNRKLQFESVCHSLESRSHTTVLEINLDAMTHNVGYFRRFLPMNHRLVAMVKAHSYGAGDVEVAQLMQRLGVNYLAVAFADEGIVLRQKGITMPILVLNADQGSFDKMISYSLEPEIYSLHSLRDFVASAERYGLSAYPIHIKLDTGMHRLGFIEQEIEELLAGIAEHKCVKVASIFAHLSCADDESKDDFTREQIALFDRLSSRIAKALPYDVIRHTANSAAIERFPEAQFDMCRLGLGLYGYGYRHNEELQPVAALKTRVVQLRRREAGEAIGYGQAGYLKRDSVIATIPIGYADGLDRHLGEGRWSMLVAGKSAPTVGRICMDSCMIDVTDIEGVQEGDQVVVFSAQAGNTTEDMARVLGTIPYEVLTSVSARVKRIYVKE